MDLAGKILIAMPGMSDPRFARTVILICAYDASGCMGFVLNRPSSQTSMQEILTHFDLAPQAAAALPAPVFLGGPVARSRGFVLHSSDWRSPEWRDDDLGAMQLAGGYSVTATLDVLAAIAAGRGPAQAMVLLGYSGWGPGQLEAEILRNDWLVSEVTPELLFDADAKQKWALALRGLGVDPVTLSATAGHA